jgi:PhnB protein
MEPTIYLFFKGDCLEAITHYAEVLGGEIGGVFRNGDAPDAESRMPGGWSSRPRLPLRRWSAPGCR